MRRISIQTSKIFEEALKLRLLDSTAAMAGLLWAVLAALLATASLQEVGLDICMINFVDGCEKHPAFNSLVDDTPHAVRHLITLRCGRRQACPPPHSSAPGTRAHPVSICKHTNSY